MRERGATVIELSLVLTVIGVLAAATAYSYQGWIEKYRIEKATCQLYTDLMQARLMAMQTNKNYIVALDYFSYSIAEDINENGKIDSGDRLLPDFPKPFEQPLCRNNTGNDLVFDTRGMISKQRKLWFIDSSNPAFDCTKGTQPVSSSQPDYDCMKVSRSRIIMGRYDGTECVPK